MLPSHKKITLPRLKLTFSTIIVAGALCGAQAHAGIIGFGFDARAYGKDAAFDTTAGNVAISGTYNDSISDGSGRYQMVSFNWTADTHLHTGNYSCANLATCSGDATDFFWYDPVSGTPYMQLNDPADYFTFGTGGDNIYSTSGGFGTWNVADIVEFMYTGTAEGFDFDFAPVSGNVSGSGSFDAGAVIDGKNPLVSFLWNADPALVVSDYECSEMALCADDLDAATDPDVILFDPVTGLPYFQFSDLDGRSLFMSYGTRATNQYSDSPGFGTWEIAELTIKEGDDGTVPAPATLSLLGAGLAGLGWSRRRKFRVPPS